MDESTSDARRTESGSLDEPRAAPVGRARRRTSVGDEHLSTVVAVRVADALGVDPLELDERLNDCVDPDALEALVASMETGSVEFEMAGRRVHVDADAAVVVEPASR